MHARTAPAPAPESGACAASVEAAAADTIRASATDTHDERRARRDGHGRRRPTAQASHAVVSLSPSTALRAGGDNRDAYNAGGTVKIADCP